MMPGIPVQLPVDNRRFHVKQVLRSGRAGAQYLPRRENRDLLTVSKRCSTPVRIATEYQIQDFDAHGAERTRR